MAAMAAETPEAYREVLELFHRFDADGNGTLSFNELREVLLQIGISAHDIPAVFGGMDTNHDGVVEWTEFVKWTWDVDASKQEALIGTKAAAELALKRVSDSLVRIGATPESLFRSADLDSNGYLTRDEVQRVLSYHDPTLTASLIEEVFTGQFDWSRDGFVDIGEFVRALTPGYKAPPHYTVPPPYTVPQYAAPPPAVAPSALHKHSSTVEVSVTVPYGIGRGQLVEVHHVGNTFHVPVPYGVRPGETFSQQLVVSSVDLQLQAPYHARTGELVTVEHEGQTYHVPVPAGVAPGSLFTVSLQVPS